MPTLEYAADFEAPVERLWALYDSLDTLLRITPPGTTVRIENPPERIAAGVRFTLIVRQPPVPFPLRWETVITRHEPPRLFIDEQGNAGPFAYWHHEHVFDPLPNGGSRLTDRVTYTPPLGILGKIADGLFIRRQLDAMFAFRHAETRRLLEK